MAVLGLVLACSMMGAAIGFTGGVLGIGGGLLAIPLLGLIMGMEQQLAQGTALIMVLPAVLMTLRQYHRYARLDLKAGLIGGLAAMAFTWVGAQAALGLDSVSLRRVYAGFVFCIALFYFYQSSRPRRAGGGQGSSRQPAIIQAQWAVAIGALAGLAGGFFGVGGSLVVVPLLTSAFRYSQTAAQGLALSMVVPGSAVALMTYSLHGQADWLVGIPLAAGSIFLVPYGVRLAYALPEPRLKLIFACLLLVIMVMLLFRV